MQPQAFVTNCEKSWGALVLADHTLSSFLRKNAPARVQGVHHAHHCLQLQAVLRRAPEETHQIIDFFHCYFTQRMCCRQYASIAFLASARPGHSIQLAAWMLKWRTQRSFDSFAQSQKSASRKAPEANSETPVGKGPGRRASLARSFGARGGNAQAGNGSTAATLQRKSRRF